ncbi:MAG: hypothetical protein JOY96_00785 [Verrucomicrobia bacterium]|nr:hypothetical protein [Verrucomicrobiota bacterium]
MLRAICCLVLVSSAHAEDSMDVLLNAASSFSATVAQQLEMLDRDPSADEFAEKTVDYAMVETAYFEALRAAIPVVEKSTAHQESSLQLQAFAAAAALANDEQAEIADKYTLAFFRRLPRNAETDRAWLEFQHAQRAEAKFHDYFSLSSRKRH